MFSFNARDLGPKESLGKTYYGTRNILDCDQSNVLLARIIFSCILPTAF